MSATTSTDPTDDERAPRVVTVFDRLTAAGISPASVRAHLTAGRVIVDGRRVLDPATPAPKPARIVLGASPTDPKTNDAAPTDRREGPK